MALAKEQNFGQKKKIPFYITVFKVFLVLFLLACIVLFSAYKLGKPLLYLNISPSAPLGLYVADFSPGYGYDEYVIVRLGRDYGKLKGDSLLLKRVKGLPGDIYIRKPGMFFVGGVWYGTVDDKRLPQVPEGTYSVPDGYVLLLNDRENSFDGRYIGPVKEKLIRAKVKLLWDREKFWESERKLYNRVSEVIPLKGRD